MPISLERLQQLYPNQTRTTSNIPKPKEEEDEQGFIERFNVLPSLGAIGGGILGTFAAPGAGTIGGGAIGAGLGEGLEQLLTGKFNPKGLAFEAATGGVGGALSKGLFGLGRGAAQVVPQVGKEAAKQTGKQAVQQVGKQAAKFGASELPPTLQKGVGATLRGAFLQGGDDIFAPRNAAKVLDAERRYRIIGSNAAKAERAFNVFEIIQDKIGRTLTGLPKVSNLASKVNNVFKSKVSSELSEFADEKALKNVTKTIEGRINEALKSGDVSKLNSLKSEVRSVIEKQLRSGKAAGGIDTPTRIKSEAYDKFYDAIKESIDDVVGDDTIRVLNTDQHLLFESAAGRLANEGLDFALLGTTLSPLSRPVQAAADIAGRGIQNIEEFAPIAAAGRIGLPQSAAGQLIPRALGGNLSQGGGATQQPQNLQQLQQLQQTGVAGGGIPQPLGTDITQEQPLVTREQALQMLASGVKPSVVNAAFSIGGPQASENVPLALVNEAAAVRKGDVLLDTLLQQYQNLGATGPIGGRAAGFIGGLTGGQAFTNERAFNEIKEGLLSNIAKGISQEVGRLTEFDVERARALAPRLEDSPALARQKYLILKQMIAQRGREIDDLIKQVQSGQVSSGVSSGFSSGLQPQGNDILNQLVGQ